MDNTNLKDKCTELSKTFNFYYHAPENHDYSLESYIEILSFNTVEEFWVLDKYLKRDMIENGMFFIMIDPILPIWEDKSNIGGGCVSWKVERKNSYKFWIDTIAHFLTQNLGNYTNKINGISISPKKNSSIIKIWFKEEIDIALFKLPDTYLLTNENIIYKSHVQNLDKDRNKKTFISGGHANPISINNTTYPTTNFKYENTKLKYS